MGSSESKVPVASGDDRQVPEELKFLHDYYEKWNEEMSGTWYNLVSEKVRDILALNPDLKIEQCIVFGLGSLDLALQNQHPLTGMQLIDINNWEEMESGGDYHPNVVRQFVVVRTTMDCIKEAAHPISTYFQDPDFTELDKAYLRYHGFEVLEDDNGVGMLNSTTLMVNLNVDMEKWIAALKAPPAVYVGPSCESLLEHRMTRRVRYRKATGKEDELSLGPLEDYVNITNAYIFPRSDPQEYNEALRLKSQLQSAAVIGLQLDRWAFNHFEIRAIKTVHKDHQPS